MTSRTRTSNRAIAVQGISDGGSVKRPMTGLWLRISSWQMCALLCALLWGFSGTVGTAAEPVPPGVPVTLVIGPQAPPLEQLAAREITTQFKSLFDIEVRTVTTLPEGAGPTIILGSPTTNPAITAVGIAWPQLSAQGHLLRSTNLKGQPILVVGGQTPLATLWGAYELGYQFGIRYALFGDLYPGVDRTLKLDGFDLVFEPDLKVRTWRTINDFPIGPESWGLAEHQKLVTQLAKLKFNRLMLSVYPWQAYADFEFQGVKKETGIPWFGYRFPVDGDIAGRSVFKGAKLFENPDFAGKQSYAERVAAAQTQARGIIAAAHELGMETAISLSPLEFPREFQAVLPGSKIQKGLQDLTIGPGEADRGDNSPLMQLAKTQIRSYLTAYPEVDVIYLTLPEFPEWGAQAEAAWQSLRAQTGLAQTITLDTLSQIARDRMTTASGERGVSSLRGNVTALEFFHRLLADESLHRTGSGKAIRYVITDIDAALYPYLDKVVPAGTATLHFVDYTARRVVENQQLLSQIPAEKVPSSLILTLADDNIGVLPQMSTSSLQPLVEAIRHQNWDGFSTRYWMVGDLDASVHYLSRASFDSRVTPQTALEEFVTASLGEGTFERTRQAFEMIEQATNLIDEHDLGFSFPIPNVLMKHYANTEPLPEWLGKARGLYGSAMNEMYRVNTRTRDGNRIYSLYLARRFEFGAEYLNCVEALRRAGIAKAQGDDETRIAELEKALESLHTALNAMAAVARSNSDRGLIAVLNEFGYRQLQKELEAE